MELTKKKKKLMFGNRFVWAEDLTDEELDIVHEEITLKNNLLAKQIFEAKNNETGERAEQGWMNRLVDAKRWTGADLQWIVQEKARRKKEQRERSRPQASPEISLQKEKLKAETRMQLATIFVSVVRESVDNELFDMFLSEAKRRAALSKINMQE